MFMSEDAFTDIPSGDGTTTAHRNQPPPTYVGMRPAPPRRSKAESSSRPVPPSSSRAKSESFGAPVRPVSARSFSRSHSLSQSKGLETKVYHNDLFGNEASGGDINKKHEKVPASLPEREIQQENMTGAQRLEQQKAAAAAKRRERALGGGLNKSNGSRPLARPPSASSMAARPQSLRSQYKTEAPKPESPRKVPADNVVEDMYSQEERKKEMERTLAARSIKTVYEPSSMNDGFKQDENGELLVDPNAMTDMAKFLSRPGPSTGTVKCTIRRVREKLRMHPSYFLYLDDGEKFLLSARKRKKSASANYLVSLDMEDLSKHSDSYFGKVRSNFMGSQFTLYDTGISPRNMFLNMLEEDDLRTELGVLTYEYNILGTRGPRQMHAYLPRVNKKTGEAVRFRPNECTDGPEGILDTYKAGNTEDVLKLSNKRPKWNEELSAYCLNFGGRVTMASVKNFQLASEEDPDDVILQFGKVGEHEFTMDYKFPLSALQAFMICLSSFDSKMACE